MSEQFACNMEKVEGYPCPAVRAGYSEQSTRAGVVAEAVFYYDSPAPRPELIDEETAKSRWLDAIEAVEDEHGEDSEKARVAREVASELGWLDDE